MSTQWANIGEDPGALHALIERIPEHTAIETIDYLWLFPPRRIAIGESIVVVIGSFDEDPERRRVSTAHFTIARNRKGAATVNAHFDEHGSAPVGAVSRIVQGVLRRLGEDTEASPREESVGGDPERWSALIVELGGPPRTAPVEADAGDELGGPPRAAPVDADAVDAPVDAAVDASADAGTTAAPADGSNAGAAPSTTESSDSAAN